jgi:exosortase
MSSACSINASFFESQGTSTKPVKGVFRFNFGVPPEPGERAMALWGNESFLIRAVVMPSARQDSVRSLFSQFSHPVKVGTALLGMALGWVYWPTLLDCFQRWSTDPRYSHGYLVPLFSGYLLWSWREQFPKEAYHGQNWGLFLLGVGLGISFLGTYLAIGWLNGISLLPCVAGLTVLMGGWSVLRWSWPAIAFLLFMLPLPFLVETALANRLQPIATIASTFVLQTLGFVAFSEGNVICLGEIRIGVVEACSGLNTLMLFFALSTAVTLIIQRSRVEKGLLLLSAIPIALIANITRITVTGILHKTVGSAVADLVFHDLAGWLMIVLALGLLWIELRVLSWVLVPEQVPWVFWQPFTKSAKVAVAASARGTALS